MTIYVGLKGELCQGGRVIAVSRDWKRVKTALLANPPSGLGGPQWKRISTFRWENQGDWLEIQRHETI